jgi:hypothetical protein
MASITNYGAYQFHLEMKDGSGTFPTTYYAGLWTTAPALDGTGGVEMVANAWYTARVDAHMDTASSAGRSLTNDTTVQLTASATAIPSVNPTTTVCITDSATIGGGNIWFILPLTSSLTIGIGTPVIFPVGQLVHEFLTT